MAAPKLIKLMNDLLYEYRKDRKIDQGVMYDYYVRLPRNRHVASEDKPM